MLRTIDQDLTVVNTKWLPGAQSTLAIGTKSFIKVFNLAEDTLAPTHNIMIFNGFITDFAFSSRRAKQSGHETTVFAASNQGILYHQAIEYNNTKPEGEKRDDHELMMTEQVALDENYEAKKVQCLSVHCTSSDALLLSLSNGSLLIGNFDG